jgi:hypothetical protein
MKYSLLAVTLCLSLYVSPPVRAMERGSPVIDGAAGNYGGLLQVAGPSPNGGPLNTGSLTALVNESGRFSAVLNWRGFKYPFKGRFDAETLDFSNDFPEKGNPGGTLALKLNLVTSNHTVHAELTVEADPAPYVAVADLSGEEPDPTAGEALAGSVNTSFIAPPDYGSLPQDLRGDGFTIARVAKNRGFVARLIGRLPDNEPFSAGSFLRGTEYDIFSGLYRKNGNFGGTTYGKVSIADLESLQNVLLWAKRAGSNPKYYPAGFDTGFGFKTARYLISQLRGDPFRKIPKISVDPGSVKATLTFSDGNLGRGEGGAYTTFTVKIRLTTFGTKVLQPNPYRVSLRTNAVNATWQGSFTHPVSGRRTVFHGAFVQAKDGVNGEGRGSFKGSVPPDSLDLVESGSVRMSVD